MLILLCKMAAVFFYIGLFGFGGGYAMISLIQFEVVNEFQWMTTSEFANLLAISQMTPGPISINSATYVGYSVFAAQYGPAWGILGATVATLSLCLPSILLMYLVIRFLFKNEDNKYVKAVFSGLRPAVVGLIFSAGFMMMVNCDPIHDYIAGMASDLTLSWKEENFGTSLFEHLFSVLICAGTFIALYFFKKNAMALILISGLVGFTIYYMGASYLLP